MSRFFISGTVTRAVVVKPLGPARIVIAVNPEQNVGEDFWGSPRKCLRTAWPDRCALTGDGRGNASPLQGVFVGRGHDPADQLSKTTLPDRCAQLPITASLRGLLGPWQSPGET